MHGLLGDGARRRRAEVPVAVAAGATPPGGAWYWEATFTVGGEVASMPGPLLRVVWDLCETLPRLVAERPDEFVSLRLARHVGKAPGRLH